MKLLAALLLALSTALLLSPARAQAIHDCDPAPGPLTALEQAVIDQNNVWRLAHGLPPLLYSVSLERIARPKARRMAATGNAEHDEPGLGWQQRFADCGFDSVKQWLGENLAAGQRTATQVEGDWQASPAHNANLLRPQFHFIGVAEVEGVGPYFSYWAMTLAGGN